MLEKELPEISVKAQADLLGVSYSSLFYQPTPPSERELAIKRRIDEIYTATPFYGSLVANAAVAALAADPEKGKPFVQALWDTQVPSGQWRYYDGMLYILALLHVSGNF